MPRGLGIILFGIEGIGKTSFSLQFPKPLHILPIKEPGFDNLEMVGEVPAGCTRLKCANWEDVLVAVKACQAKTLVIDSISGLQEYLIPYVVQTCYDGNFKAFKSFYNGLRQDCPREMSMFLDIIEFKRAQGLNIVFCAHRKNDVDPDTGGADVQVQTLFGDEGITGPLRKWAQAILFMSGKRNIDIVTQSAGYGQDTKVLEGKSTGAPTRLMYTSFSGYHIAKNTLHLPPVIPMGKSAIEGYTNFYNALPEPIRKNLV